MYHMMEGPMRLMEGGLRIMWDTKRSTFTWCVLNTVSVYDAVTNRSHPLKDLSTLSCDKSGN